MLTTLTKAFIQGDWAELQSKLLHSTSWTQHHATMYGTDQLRRIPIAWLKLAGKCSIEHSLVINQGQQQVIQFDLTPQLPQSSQPTQSSQANHQSIPYIFWLETNGKVIKSVDAILDTRQLALATNHTPAELAQNLPQPDPLVLPAYDQQDHLQGDLATPENIGGLTGDLAHLLNTWWRIWSIGQLSEITAIYAENATISLPAADSKDSRLSLFHYISNQYSALTRIFCQIEKLISDTNQVAIKWHLDADEQGSGIRVPFITILTIEDGKIIADNTCCDIIAHGKRFTNSKLFTD